MCTIKSWVHSDFTIFFYFIHVSNFKLFEGATDNYHQIFEGSELIIIGPGRDVSIKMARI